VEPAPSVAGSTCICRPNDLGGSKRRRLGIGVASLSASVLRPATKGVVMTALQIEQRAATSTRWTVDPNETSVEFSVRTFWGLMRIHGRFDRFEGSYEVGPGGASIELSIDADSLDTGHVTRDKHLRSTDFFHVVEHPQVRFTSTRVDQLTGDILHVVGRLEAAGEVLLLEFPATLRQLGDAIEIEATTTIDQRQLGMSSGQLGMIRPPATLHVNARLGR
jgi:polyisoprenoid-binding protein YceI